MLITLCQLLCIIAEEEMKVGSFQSDLMAIFASLLFFLLALIVLIVKRPKKDNQPPSPSKLPIIGNLHQLGSFPHHSLRTLSNKHGPLMLLHLGRIPTLVVSSSDMAEKVLKTHDRVFSSRPTSKATNRLLYGCADVAFAPYGEYWRKMRKICFLDLLDVKRVQSFAFIVREEVANMVKDISGSCSSSTDAVNLSDMLLAFFSSIISRVALGKKYIGGGEHDKNTFVNLAREFVELLGAFSVSDCLPWLGWIDSLTGLNAKLKRNSQGFDHFINQVIHDHLTRSANCGDEEDNDLVDVLLRIQKDCADNISLTSDNIKAVILDMLAGATDTTTVTLEWAMAELVKNPLVMEKAQAEVRRVVGRKQGVEEGHLLQMDYLKSIVKETLRFHPAGPLLLPRESTASVTIEGYHIPPKTRVLINAWAIARDPKSWDNADKFLPERFAMTPVDFKGHDFQFIPFGTGRRSCPAMSFAISTIELALANLLYWFDWELPGGTNKVDLDMREAGGVTVRKKLPLLLVPECHFS